MCARPASTRTATKVLDYVRWVMVRKRDEAAAAPGDHVPELPATRRSPRRSAPPARTIDARALRFRARRQPASLRRLCGRREDRPCRRHDGRGSRAQMATRLYQNTAHVHFNQFTESKGRFGRRLIYGGHVISLARALSFNGLANAFHIAASMAAAMSRRCSPATRSSPGRRCWRRPSCRAARRRRAAPAHRRHEGPARARISR